MVLPSSSWVLVPPLVSRQKRNSWNRKKPMEANKPARYKAPSQLPLWGSAFSLLALLSDSKGIICSFSVMRLFSSSMGDGLGVRSSFVSKKLSQSSMADSCAFTALPQRGSWEGALICMAGSTSEAIIVVSNARRLNL